MRSAAASKVGYHHGSLREALVSAAYQLVESRGADNFTLKDASKLAGVSVAAPYRHFEDKSDLLAAVAALGFRMLRDDCIAARDTHEPASLEGLLAMGRAYINIARQHPHVFRLMFGLDEKQSAFVNQHLAEDIKDKVPAGLCGKMQAAEDGFAIFLDSITDLIAARGGPPSDLMRLALPLWSLVHGTASLLIDEGFNRMAPDSDTDIILADAMHFMFHGYQPLQSS